MQSLTGVWIFCVVVLCWTELAVGTVLCPTEYDLIQSQCSQPPPDCLCDDAQMTVVSTTSCGCNTLTVVYGGTESTYKVTVISGCLIIEYNRAFYVVIVDQKTRVVYLRNCVPYEIEGELIVFAFNDKDVLSAITGDSQGAFYHTKVTRSQTTYEPREYLISSRDYTTYHQQCLEQLPTELSVISEKRIVEDINGYLFLECTIPRTAQIYNFQLILISEAGLFACQDNSGSWYLVVFVRETLYVTVRRAVLTTLGSRSVLLALNDYNKLCSTTYNTWTGTVSYTVIGEERTTTRNTRKSTTKSSGSGSSESSDSSRSSS